MYGTGEQRRCFCDVRDVVRALAELQTCDDFYAEVFNIGSTEEVSILSLAERAQVATGSDPEIVTIPYTEALSEGFEDMPRRIPDTGKIERALGWQPTATLDEILSDVIVNERGTAGDGLESQTARPR